MDLIIVSVLLLIAAETTYLTLKQSPRFAFRSSGRPVFVDTSVLIDGRIVAVAETGFITSSLFVPRSVVGELQYMADQADHDKRSRARFGLDVIGTLQALKTVDVTIFKDDRVVKEGVDNRLLSLAKRYKGVICTVDYNLIKVADVESIPVLNINELAKTIRMSYLPGEKVMLALTQKGNDLHQAVGHLSDGTMVVVEQASSLIGQVAEIEFIRGLQTVAGKMMFARLAVPVQPQTRKEPVVKRGRPEKGRAPGPQKEQPDSPAITTAIEPAASPRRRSGTRPTTPENPPTRKSQPSQSRRKRSNEDNLIDLLNQQD